MTEKLPCQMLNRAVNLHCDNSAVQTHPGTDEAGLHAQQAWETKVLHIGNGKRGTNPQGVPGKLPWNSSDEKLSPSPNAIRYQNIFYRFNVKC